MLSSFSTALSGLNADSNAINVVGNDLANLNTVGFKANQVHFSDLIAQQIGNGSQVGLGVAPVSSLAEYSQGSIQTTGGPTDAAIQGNGFFVVKDANNMTNYTRDGSFQVGPSGLLVSASGDPIQGWSSVNGAVNTSGPIGNISVPLGMSVPATATGNISFGLNLDSRAAADKTSNFSTPVTVYDSQGQSHVLTASFSKTDANSWSYSITLPASDLKAGGSNTLASGTLTFDANGKLSSPSSANGSVALSATGLADGASDLKMNWNLFDSTTSQASITQVAATSSASSITQDGFAAGQINKVTLQNGGMLVANYSNGQNVTVGQVAIASIANPDSLAIAGNNYLQATSDTATPSIGTAGTGGRGQVLAGALESSTVDIAKEFTDLLTYQRSYQANSRVITTTDQLLQETVNLIHP